MLQKLKKIIRILFSEETPSVNTSNITISFNNLDGGKYIQRNLPKSAGL